MMRTLLLVLLLAAGCAGVPDPPPVDDPGQVLAAATRFGTGFWIGPEHLMTAAHVVAGCETLWAFGEGGGPALARLLLADTELDVAVLQAGRRQQRHAWLAAAASLPGADLVAIGYSGPAAHGLPVRSAFRTILLPLPRPDEQTALRGAAAPGMSGSPLVDVTGKVAGMLLAKGDATAPGSPALGQRLGFPVDGLAVMVPAPWLQAAASLAGIPDPPLGNARPDPPAVARIVCTEMAGS